MAFLRQAEIRARALRRAGALGISVEEALSSAARQRMSRYDIFLSQTIRDAEIVLGVYDLLTSAGYSVFCDWIEAPDTDRSKVTPANAALIRATMGVSDTLLFLDTKGADQSLWMCWELGWFDGGRGPVAVLPVLTEGEWARGEGLFRLLFLFRNKVRRTFDVRFSAEVGRRKGSWKGGTVGHSGDIAPGEALEAAFRRYCEREGLTFIGEALHDT